MVPFVDRARAILVSFSSNHDSGTALPPPSGRGLRRKGSVTSAFALPRPAPRRPRAVTHGNVAARRRARARARTPPDRRIFSSCPCSPPSFAAHAASSGRGPSLPSAIRHKLPFADHRGPCGRSGPVRSPSELSLQPPFAPSAPPPEVPGFGAVLIAPPAPVTDRVAGLLADLRSVPGPVAGGEVADRPRRPCSRPSGGSPSRLRLSARS
jgi:hypothetical protein